jgi:hypothetical protein
MSKPKLNNLRYTGPISTFSVLTVDPKKNTEATKAAGEFHWESEDRVLVPGLIYNDLPSEHPVIKNLIAKKLLIETEEETTGTAPPKPTFSDSGTDPSGDGDGGTDPEVPPNPALSDSSNAGGSDDRSTKTPTTKSKGASS